MALQTSLETKLSDIANNITKALEALSERLAICEEQCKEPVNPSKRRHEDSEGEGGPYGGEKHRRLTNIPQGRSIRTMPLSDREEGSSRGGGWRYLGRDEYVAYLAGGEEISQQEMEQMIQERNARIELTSSPDLLINFSERLNAPETPVHGIDQTLTLGSREVATSRSRLDYVEAFIDSIADSVN